MKNVEGGVFEKKQIQTLSDISPRCVETASPEVTQPLPLRPWMRLDEVISGLFGEEHAAKDVDGLAVVAGGGDTDALKEKGDVAEMHQRAMSILAGIGDVLHYKKAHDRLDSTCKRTMNLFSGATVVACPSPLNPFRAFQREHAAAPRRLPTPHIQSRSIIKKTRPPAAPSNVKSFHLARDAKTVLASSPHKRPPPPPEQVPKIYLHPQKR